MGALPPRWRQITAGRSARLAARCLPKQVSRRNSSVASSADLAHVGDITAPDIPAAPTATRWSRISAHQTAWLAGILVVILAALGGAAVRVPDAGQRHHRGPEHEQLGMGAGQFRSGAQQPALRQHQLEFAGLCRRERGAGAADRLGDGLDRRAHQHAAQGARLSDRDHLARHALHPLCHAPGCCSSARPAR